MGHSGVGRIGTVVSVRAGGWRWSSDTLGLGVPGAAATQLLSVGDPADVAVIENAGGFCGLVGTVTPIVAK